MVPRFAVFALALISAVALPVGSAQARELGLSALQTIDDCDRLQRHGPRDYPPYQCYWSVSRQKAQGEPVLQRLQALTRIDPKNDIARLYLGVVLCDRSDKQGVDQVQQALAGLQRDRAWRGVAYAEVTLSTWYRSVGPAARGLDAIERAWTAAQLDGSRDLRWMVQIERGWQHYRAGDNAHADAIFRQLTAEVGDQPLSVETWRAFDGLAASSWGLSNFDDAVNLYRRVCDFKQAQGALSDEASCRFNLLLTLEWAQASAAQKQAEIERIEQIAEQFVPLRDQARYHRFRAQVDQGAMRRDDLERAIRAARVSGDVVELITSLVSLGKSCVMDSPAQPDRAIALTREAVLLARADGSDRMRLFALTEHAFALLRAGRRDEGLAMADRMLAELELARMRTIDPVTRSRVFARWSNYYAKFASWLIGTPADHRVAPDVAAKAFGLVERAKAREILDLAAQRAAGLAEPVSPELQAVLDAIAEQQRRLLEAKRDEGARTAALQHLTQLEGQELALREQRAALLPQVGSNAVISLPALQDRLGPRRAVLSYGSGVNDSVDAMSGFLLVTTQSEFRVYPVDHFGRVFARIQRLQGLIERRDGSERSAMIQLHRELIGAALADLAPEVTELLIAPDWTLHALPFSLLRASESSPPLGERFAITMIPSATAWVESTTQQASDPATTVRVLADPQLPVASARPALSRDWALLGAVGLGELPFARREAHEIENLVDGAEILIGARASEAYLKRTSLTGTRVVHFAAHAVIDSDQPQRSAVLLAPGNEREDGLLQPREILDLDLRGKLVVLSSCGSAMGRVQWGDGPSSLAQAFLKAGARTVIGNLWPVRDEDAAAVVAETYRQLVKGESVTKAMSAAHRVLDRGGAPAAAWAGFVVLGDGSFVPFPGGHPMRTRPTGTWVGLAALAIVISGFGAWLIRGATLR